MPEQALSLIHIFAKAAKLAKKIMTHEKDVLGCEGYNLVQKNGEVAGQTVFHLSLIHICKYSAKPHIYRRLGCINQKVSGASYEHGEAC